MMLMKRASSREHLSESSHPPMLCSHNPSCASPGMEREQECLAEEQEMEENQRQDSVVDLFMLEALK